MFEFIGKLRHVRAELRPYRAEYNPGEKKMARPIKETPVLRGKSAREFEKRLKDTEGEKVPASEYKRAMDTYDKIKVVGQIKIGA